MADEPRIKHRELMALTQSYMPTTPTTFEGRGAIIPRLAFDLRRCRNLLDAATQQGDDCRAQLEAVTRELSHIDGVLARRPALDGFDMRASKIEHAIKTAADADSLRAQLEEVTKRLDDVMMGRDAKRENRLAARVVKLEAAGAEMRDRLQKVANITAGHPVDADRRDRINGHARYGIVAWDAAVKPEQP